MPQRPVQPIYSTDFHRLISDARSIMTETLDVREPTFGRLSRMEQIRGILCAEKIAPAWYWESQASWGSMVAGLNRSAPVATKLEQNYVGNSRTRTHFGRFYPSGKDRSPGTVSRKKNARPRSTLTFCPSPILALLLGDNEYVELDMINAAPTIAAELGRALGVEMPGFRHYCAERDACLEKVQSVYNVSRITAKNLFLRVMFGGSMAAWLLAEELTGKGENDTTRLVGQLVAEQILLIEALEKDTTTALGHLFKAISGSYNRSCHKTTPSSSLAILMQDLEAMIMKLVCKNISSSTPLIYKFDGVIVRPNALKSTSWYESLVTLNTGFKIKFDIKPVVVPAALRERIPEKILQIADGDAPSTPSQERAASSLSQSSVIHVDPANLGHFDPGLEDDEETMVRAREKGVPEFLLWQTYTILTLLTEATQGCLLSTCEDIETASSVVAQRAQRCIILMGNGNLFIRTARKTEVEVTMDAFHKSYGHEPLGLFATKPADARGDDEDPKMMQLYVRNFVNTKYLGRHRTVQIFGVTFQPMPPDEWTPILPNGFINRCRGMRATYYHGWDADQCWEHIDLVIHHFYSVICSSDERNFNFLMTYIHYLIFEPTVKHGVCPFITGPHGVGKSTVTRVIRAVLGDELCAVFTTIEQLSARFSVTSGFLFGSVEEAEEGRQNQSVLKTRVTEHKVYEELKGIQGKTVQCFIKLMLISNGRPDLVLKLASTERRFGFLHAALSAELMGDDARERYWGPLNEQIDKDLCFANTFITWLRLHANGLVPDNEYNFTLVDLRNTNNLPIVPFC
jgi:hypothetical protein